MDELVGPSASSEWTRTAWVLVLQKKWRDLSEAVEELAKADQWASEYESLLELPRECRELEEVSCL